MELSFQQWLVVVKRMLEKRRQTLGNVTEQELHSLYEFGYTPIEAVKNILVSR